MSQPTWVLALALSDLTGCVTLASQAGPRSKPTYPVWPLSSSNETKPGRAPAHSPALRGCQLQDGLYLLLQSVWPKREAFLLADAVTLQFWACHMVPGPQLHISLWLRDGT